MRDNANTINITLRNLPTMDTILCDELFHEIFRRLSPPSSSAVSLVSKRWLRLLRSSKSSLSLRISPPFSKSTFISFLSHHAYLSSISLSTAGDVTTCFSDHLLICISSTCPNLQHLRFLGAPVSLSSLISLSTNCSRLSSLTIFLSRPLSFGWLIHFTSLRNLSVICSGVNSGDFDSIRIDSDAEFELDSLCVTGIRTGDLGLNWVWRNCKTLKKLGFKSCESVGDNASFSGFIKCLNGLQEVELRTCRSIVDGVLFNLAENCTSLSSLLIYDGGSKEGLLHFIRHCRCNLQKIDLRLPLDLDNSHLLSIAENFKCLSSFRLQSCCLVTGEGVKTLAVALGNNLEELVLINCDVIERESGLLLTLGQSLKQLKKLDLSYNDTLFDKELVSMLVSCDYLRELKLRGCSGLTNAAGVLMSKNCKFLESVDIMNCCGIEEEAVELFVINSPRLKRLKIEDYKLSAVVKTLAMNKVIEVIE